jgi:hypothetical protein
MHVALVALRVDVVKLLPLSDRSTSVTKMLAVIGNVFAACVALALFAVTVYPRKR